MPRRPAPFEVLVIVLAFGHGVAAQLTSAVCQAGFDWTFNTRGQSPCVISAYLDGACEAQESDAFIDSLSPDNHYTLPASAADDCYCSTVFYSTLAACAACQGAESLPWTTWKTNCTNSFVQTFPRDVPIGTAIPAWAYLDVTTSDSFNLTTARAYASQNTTEIAAPSSTTSSSTSPSSTSASGSSSSSTPTGIAAPSNNTSKKTNTGAIVGGVVGGVGGAAVLLFALFFWYRHRKAQRRPPSAQFRQPSPTLITAPWTPDAEKRFSPVLPPMSPTSLVPVRIYNPDDPSTFPDAQPRVDSIYSQSTRGSAVFSAQNGYQPAGIRFNGAPEL